MAAAAGKEVSKPVLFASYFAGTEKWQTRKRFSVKF